MAGIASPLDGLRHDGVMIQRAGSWVVSTQCRGTRRGSGSWGQLAGGDGEDLRRQVKPEYLETFAQPCPRNVSNRVEDATLENAQDQSKVWGFCGGTREKGEASISRALRRDELSHRSGLWVESEEESRRGRGIEEFAGVIRPFHAGGPTRGGPGGRSNSEDKSQNLQLGAGRSENRKRRRRQRRPE